ncbi:cytochrome c [Phenylobacterium sp.]|jgi:cytochrome c556|uniref:c-type cytochrome n=1 Tax=Phenylobacterium sp. TaxID=1871053 RepID=UPI002E304789|nr:cytochrome c [Phenylobacterium sp.]HEX2559103.1 cytochrome c [Phenylobacterium sp.]
MKAKWVGTAAALAVTLAGGAALGQGVADVIKARQQGYKAQGAAFKAINDELKKDAPSVAVIQKSAKVLTDTGAMQYRWFPKGSGPQTGVKTAAKAEIWSDPAGFTAAQKAFQAEANKLGQAAAKGDLGAIRPQVGATGKTCAGCHNKYRVKT